MKNISVEQLLKARFLVANVKNIGECIIVPASEFKRAWRAQLKAAGLHCVNGRLDGQPVKFIKLKGD